MRVDFARGQGHAGGRSSDLEKSCTVLPFSRLGLVALLEVELALGRRLQVRLLEAV